MRNVSRKTSTWSSRVRATVAGTVVDVAARARELQLAAARGLREVEVLREAELAHEAGDLLALRVPADHVEVAVVAGAEVHGPARRAHRETAEQAQHHAALARGVDDAAPFLDHRVARRETRR